MIFPGFPGVLSFFQVFQVEWEPCDLNVKVKARLTTEYQCAVWHPQKTCTHNTKFHSHTLSQGCQRTERKHHIPCEMLNSCHN